MSKFNREKREARIQSRNTMTRLAAAAYREQMAFRHRSLWRRLLWLLTGK